MLDILIVEDSDKKLELIMQLLASYPELKTGVCEVRKDIISAKKALRDRQYDLVILDIQLPLRQGEIPKGNGGEQLLEEIHARSLYFKPHCIVGLTEYSDLIQKAKHIFEDNCWSIIFFDHSNSEWSDRLSKKIEYIIESKRAHHDDHKYGCDVGIITALVLPEYQSVVGLCTDWKPKEIANDTSKYIYSNFTSANKNLSVVAACSPQMGMPAAAVTTTKFINHFHPRYLAMVGITAGVKGKVNIGDLLVADPTWDWGSGKRKVSDGSVVMEPDPLHERLLPELKTMFQDIQLDESLLSNIGGAWTKEKPPSKPTLHIGPLASGSSVLCDGKTVPNIKEHSRKLIGVDMEAYGFMHATVNALEPKPKAFCMKSVCDFGDDKKNDDWQEYAAFVSATFLKQIALKYFVI